NSLAPLPALTGTVRGSPPLRLTTCFHPSADPALFSFVLFCAYVFDSPYRHPPRRWPGILLLRRHPAVLHWRGDPAARRSAPARRPLRADSGSGWHDPARHRSADAARSAHGRVDPDGDPPDEPDLPA